MSNVTALYHIVFCTRGREMTLPYEYREDIYRFIWRIIEDANCKLIRIGGIANHVHILVDINPTIPLSKLVQKIKALSSGWMKTDPRFSTFMGWGKEYFACTVSPKHKHNVIEYINNQRQHHLGAEFDVEMRELYSRAGHPYSEFALK